MFIRLGPKRQEFPIAVLIPNLLTTVALCCGLAALYFAMEGRFERAMVAVVLSGVFDALDGRAARMLRVSSGFGAVLDSLSDFLGFGVAPGVIVLRWLSTTEELGRAERGFLLAAVMTFALCAALRLARFTAAAPGKAAAPANQEPLAERGGTQEPAPSKHFTGMPTPAAAGAGLMFPFLWASETIQDHVGYTVPAWVVIVWMFVIGIFMISRLPMFSLKSMRVGRGAVVPVLLCVGLLVVGAIIDFWLTMAVLSAVYVASIPLTVIGRMRAARAG